MKGTTKTVLLLAVGICLLSLACRTESFRKVEVDNAEYRENVAFESFEDLSSAKFEDLKSKYQLDSLFSGDEDEFTRILLLRDWIRNVVPIRDFGQSYPGDGQPEGILDAALEGEGFHCGHYMVVQNAIMNAYGYVTRCLGAGPGVEVDDQNVLFSHHGVNEIWSNTYHKWFLSDAKYNHHFEKDGIPLSALEIRDEYLKNGAKDIVMVKGPGRVLIDFDWLNNRDGHRLQISKSSFAQTYTWISWDATNNRFTGWPDNDDSAKLIFYEDDYSSQRQWMRDGTPHWAYGTEYLSTVDDREAIEWTPNTVDANTTIHGRIARVELRADTSNLETYQMRMLEDSAWTDISSPVEVELEGDRTEMLFRTVNLAGIAGRPYRVVIEKE